jgi:hypothetical protein
VVDKILTTYMARDVNLPTLIREKRSFKRFTPADVIGRIEEQLITIKEAKISQEMSMIHEQFEKNNGVALKASKKEKCKTIFESTSSRKEESDSDKGMALFIKRFKRVMKKDGYFINDNRRSKIKRKSNKPFFWSGEVGHLIADCPNPKNMNKSEKKEYSKGKKKYSGEVHLGQEWDSSEESSDEEGVATMAMEADTINSSLFGDLTQ